MEAKECPGAVVGSRGVQGRRKSQARSGRESVGARASHVRAEQVWSKEREYCESTKDRGAEEEGARRGDASSETQARRRTESAWEEAAN